MRALKNDTATLNIAVSVVAPGITLTDLVSGRDPGELLSGWAKRMRGLGVPIKNPVEVAAAVIWLMNLGMGANGKGLLVQAGKVADGEEWIARNRKAWMGAEMLALVRGGRTAPLFPKKSCRHGQWSLYDAWLFTLDITTMEVSEIAGQQMERIN